MAALRSRTHPIVDICQCINGFRPGEALAKRVPNRLIFPGIGVRIQPTNTQVRVTYCVAMTESASVLNCLLILIGQSPVSFPLATNMHCTFVYFGSRCTYPLLIPLTSLTTSSKASKSSAVTASKPTSKTIRDHSKNAYFV